MKGKFSKLGLVCLALLICLAGMGVGYAHWSETLTISGAVTTCVWDRGGSPGFWKNWDSHNTYSEDQIDRWLVAIDSASAWLVVDMDGDGSIDTDDMKAIIVAGQGNNATAQFLRQYLATRLNVLAGRLLPTVQRDFDDPTNYLDLGGHGTLLKIIDCIESKYPDPPKPEPTPAQFEIMKNICEALNQDQITPFPLP